MAAIKGVLVPNEEADKSTSQPAIIKPGPKSSGQKSLSSSNPVRKRSGNPKPIRYSSEGKPAFGRPTDYRPEYCQMIVDYFNIEVERIEEISTPDPKAEGGSRKTRHVVINKYPTFERFASKIGVTRQTLHNWATDTHSDGSLIHPDFFYSYTRAKDLMTALLIEGGMAGAYDSRFASFAAKNLIGWREQVEQAIEQTITSTSYAELDAVYAKGMAAAEAGRALIELRRAAKND